MKTVAEDRRCSLGQYEYQSSIRFLSEQNASLILRYEGNIGFPGSGLGQFQWA